MNKKYEDEKEIKILFCLMTLNNLELNIINI